VTLLIFHLQITLNNVIVSHDGTGVFPNELAIVRKMKIHMVSNDKIMNKDLEYSVMIFYLCYLEAP